MWLGDFHIHSTFSDGRLSIPQLIDFYGERGFGCIAITDHLCEEKTMLGKAAAYLNKTLTRESFPRYLETIRSEGQRAWEQYRMKVIPGVELTKNSLKHHRSAHILAVGIDEYIKADLDIDQMIDKIHDAGGLAIAAHPISKGKLRGGHYHLWDNRDYYSKKFDAWEITDSQSILKEVVKTDLPKIANSDLHKAHQINSWKNVFYCEKHPEAILEAIRTQDIGFRFYQDQAASLKTVFAA